VMQITALMIINVLRFISISPFYIIVEFMCSVSILFDGMILLHFEVKGFAPPFQSSFEISI
jgi:hypothetical protein